MGFFIAASLRYVFSAYFLGSFCPRTENAKTLSIGIINLNKNLIGCNMSPRNLYVSLTVLSSFFSCSMAADKASETISPAAEAQSFSDFYVIGALGHSHLSVPRKGNVTDVVDPSLVVQNNCGFSSDRAVFSLGLGYETFVSPSVLLGIEVSGFWDNHRTKSQTNIDQGGSLISFSEILKKQYGAEVRAKVGYLIREGLYGYAGVGVENSFFSYKGTLSTAGYTKKASKALWGVFPVVGMRVFLAEKLSLDFSYKYTLYQGMSVSGGTSAQSFYRSLKPSDSVAQVGLTYKIN